MGLAEPKLAKRAKAGGARRDRTADLLHAMQALSQLSYGPVTLKHRVRGAENLIRAMGRAASFNNHTSKPTSSLLVVGDVADDVGDIVVAFFLVGDEGRIIIVIILDRLVDLDVVDRFRHFGLAVP